MQSTVILVWTAHDEQTFSVTTTLSSEQARAWLDEQFLDFDCEPLRASGKVLVADKLLAIAEAAGQPQFADVAWAQRYAEAAAAATARSLIRVNVMERTLTY